MKMVKISKFALKFFFFFGYIAKISHFASASVNFGYWLWEKKIKIKGTGPSVFLLFSAKRLKKK